MCNCKLILKKEYRTIFTSDFLSGPVNLNTINESSYEFFNEFFPQAFERKCICKKIKNDSTSTK